MSSIVCDKPKDTGECICSPGFKNSKANFRCIMYPPVLGNYSIILKNGLATAGISAFLEPGKPAIVSRLYLKDTEGELRFIIFAGAGLFLLVVTIAIIMSHKRKEKRLGPRLEEYLNYTVPHYRDELNAKFMRGDLNQPEYKSEMIRLEDNKTKAEARLREWNKRHPKKGNTKAVEAEKADQVPNAAPSKGEGLIAGKEKAKPEEGNRDLDNLLNELERKKLPENKGPDFASAPSSTQEDLSSLGNERLQRIKEKSMEEKNPEIEKLLEEKKKKEAEGGETQKGE